eukprot:3397136-Rhodomonas_salina.5
MPGTDPAFDAPGGGARRLLHLCVHSDRTDDGAAAVALRPRYEVPDTDAAVCRGQEERGDEIDALLKPVAEGGEYDEEIARYEQVPRQTHP